MVKTYDTRICIGTNVAARAEREGGYNSCMCNSSKLFFDTSYICTSTSGTFYNQYDFIKKCIPIM